MSLNSFRHAPSSQVAGLFRHPATAGISLRRGAAITVFGGVVGALYALAYGVGPDHMLRGFLIGVVIASTVVLFEVLIVQGTWGTRLQAAPFGAYLAVRFAGWTILSIAGLAVGQLLLPAGEGFRLTTPAGLIDIAFSLGVSFVAMSMLAVARLLGPDVVAALVTGRYYRPRTEERVFLLLDMVGSTALAEQFGDTVYLGILNRVLQEVTPIIQGTGGEIHRYVGDAVIVTWAPRRSSADTAGAAVACALDCVHHVDRIAARCREELGASPSLRASVHRGPVIAAEIGTVKREIAFLGDTMNTLARIEQAGRERQCTVVASADALQNASLPAGARAIPLGSFTPRGKQGAIELYTLSAANNQQSM